MKLKLLLFIALCLPAGLFAQATAYPVPNIDQCENAVFNLHVQTPLVLNGQGPFPTQFEVSYHLSLADAQNGANPISYANAANYILVGESQQIFIRVQNAIGNAVDTTSFWIGNHPIPPMIGMPDIIACGAVIMPPPAPGTSFNSGPNGTNPSVENPYFHTWYVHNSNWYCSSDYPFTITLAPPGPYPTKDVSACTTYVIPNTSGGFYYDNPEGTGPNMQVGTEITSSMTIYMIPDSTNSCFTPNSYEVHIGNPEVAQPSTPLYGCFGDPPGTAQFEFQPKFYEITTVQGNTFSVHASLAEAENNEGAIDYDAPLNISGPQTVYVRVSNGGDCYSVVTLDLIPEACAYNIIYGTHKYNANNDDCATANAYVPYNEVVRTVGDRTFSSYTNIFGDYYFIGVQEGTNHIAPTAPANFTVSPESQDIEVAGLMEWFDAQTFCFSPSTTFNDLEITLIPQGTPRPNGALSFTMLIANKGTTALSGSAVLQYNANKLTYIADGLPMVEGPGTLTFDFANINPFQIIGGQIHFTVNGSSVVAMGDNLNFMATVTAAADNNTTNNADEINQTVVNSFDPNDIIVHEGEFITQAQADDYLHYTVRFENVGTAEAHDIKIQNKFDDKLDWSTFEPIAASASMDVQRRGGEVDFNFYGIDLAPNMTNDPNLVGFLTYKIKPLPGLTVGQIISNQANILFDDNAPILTNTVTTQIASLGVAENQWQNVKIYPNPSREVVYVSLQSVAERVDVKVYDMQGKTILDANQQLIGQSTAVDVSKIEAGIYFMRISAEGKSTVKKWIKL